MAVRGVFGHSREVCEHGQVVSHFRCPGPKADKVVPCPFEYQTRPTPAEGWANQASDPLGDILAAIDLYKRS